MSNSNVRPIGDLLAAISAELSAADLLSSRLESKISLTLMSERISRNMTQAEFAKILNVNQSQISKWEAEDYNFTVEKLSEIATALDLYLDISFKKEIPLCSNQEKSCIWLQFPSGPWAVKSHKGFESEYERQEM